MELVLHIGTEKTGTTALQSWLYLNQKALSDQGVFLSDILGIPNNRKIVSYFQSWFDDFARMEKYTNREEKSLYFEGFLEQIKSEISQAKTAHHTMVITSEHFHSRLQRREELENLKSFLLELFDNIKIVCYFREQSAMRRSLYSTNLWLSTTQPIEQFQENITSENYYYNFYKIASLWADVFGTENLDFRIYDRNELLGSDIKKDFISTLPKPIDEDGFLFDVSSSNESLSYLEGRVFQAINMTVPFWNGGNNGLNEGNILLKKVINSCRTLKIGKIRDNRQDHFYQLFLESNKNFFKKFFQDKHSFPKPKKLTTRTMAPYIAFRRLEILLKTSLKN